MWLFILASKISLAQSGVCDATVPFFEADLSSDPNKYWESSEVVRIDKCCGAGGSSRCVEFEVTLHPNTAAIQFDIASGAVPGGSMFFQINCGPEQPVGTPVCVSGVGPHTITFCKPGNNLNTYSIQSFEMPNPVPDVAVADGCQVGMKVNGLIPSTIVWRDITGGGAYDAYLDATSGVDTVTATATPGYPSFVDYEVYGDVAAGPCSPITTWKDTIRVNFYPPIDATITPNPTVICAVNGRVDLTANGVGGVPPLTYRWTDAPLGAGTLIGTSQVYTATAAGNYYVEIRDATYPNCPAQFGDASVSIVPPDVVQAGDDVTVCESSPIANITGQIITGSAAYWSGNGIFGDPNSLTTTYQPTQSEIDAETATIMLISTGNASCAPDTDYLNITIIPEIEITISGDDLVCYGDLGSASAGVIGGVSPYTYSWDSGESIANITNKTPGTYTVTVTGSSAVACSAQADFTIAENPEVLISGLDNVVNSCTSNANLSGAATGGSGSFSYLWSTGGTSQNIIVEAGDYTFTATDVNGCSESFNSTVNTTLIPLDVQIDPINMVCFGESTSLNATGSGGVGAYTFNWATGESGTSVSKPAGNYKVYISDSYSCIDSATITVIEGDELTSSTSQNNALCFGGTGDATITTAGGTGAVTFLWSDGQTIETATDLIAGDYSVTATDVNGCETTQDITIIEPTLLTSSTTQNNALCFGGTGDATITTAGGSGSVTYLWSDGQTTATASNLLAGDYSVTATDVNGCKTSQNITITEPTQLTSSTTQNNALCFGGTGDVTITTAGGTGEVTYLWSDGQTSATATNLLAGDYSVTATDVNGCETTQNITITEPTLLTSSTSQNNALCFGGTGDATITTSGGTGSVTYLWSDGQTTAAATNLLAGDYSVTATDVNGCETTQNIRITEPTLLTSSTTQNNALCFGGSGDATITTGGGTGSVTYLWSDGQTAATATNLLAGDYSVTATDENGCETTQYITITEPTLLTSSTTQNNTLCFGGTGDATMTTAGGTGAVTYLWSDGQTTATATNLLAGDYSVTATDVNGCETTQNITITEPTQITSSISGTNAACYGGEGRAVLAVGGGTPGYLYSWSNGGANSINNNLLAGEYTVEITDINGCVAYDTIEITQPGSITIEITPTNALCFEGVGSATASISGGTGIYNYSWSDGSTLNTVTGLLAGSHSLTVTDANGCSNSKVFEITEPELFTSTISQNNALCFGGTGDATITTTGGTGIATFLWSDGQTAANAQGLLAGDYSVTATDANGCQSTQNITIAEPSILTATTNQVNAPCFESTGSATIIATGGVKPYTYLWSNRATDSIAKDLLAGDYFGTVTDANGCTTNVNVSITQPEVLSIEVSGSNVSCFNGANGEASVVVNGGTGVYSYGWSNAEITSSVDDLIAGEYSVVVTDENACEISSSIEITQPEALIVAETIQNVSCFEGADGAITLSVDGGVAPYSYSWSNGALTNSISDLVSGGYSVTVTDANGCELEASYSVNQPSILTLSLNPSPVSCFNGSNGAISSEVTGGTEPYIYLWNNGVSNESIENLTAGDYILNVTDAKGCSVEQTATVIEPSILAPSIVKKDVSCHGGDNGQLTVRPSGGTPPYEFEWSNGVEDSIARSLPVGDYSVTCTDANGCNVKLNSLVISPQPLAVGTITDPTYCGLPLGTAIADVLSGGTPPYEYEWEVADTKVYNDTAKNLVGGAYKVSVVDGNGCSTVQFAEVEDISVGDFTVMNVKPVSCYGGNDGGAQVAFAGKAYEPFTYTWVNVETNAINYVNAPVIVGLAKGKYVAKMVDRNGCEFVSDTIEITQPEPLIINESVTSLKCYGTCEGRIDLNVSGGTKPYIFDWDQSTLSKTEVVENLCYGRYSVEVIDANNCNVVDYFDINTPPRLEVTTGVLTEHCNLSDGTVYAEAKGGKGEYRYRWNNSFEGDSIHNLSAGTYNVAVTDENGCNVFDSAILESTPPPVMDLVSQENALCFEDCNGIAEVELTGAIGNVNYYWDNGINSPVGTNLCEGQYKVLATDSKGCKDSINILITQPDALEIELSIYHPLCNNSCDGIVESAVAGGTGAYTYNWKDNLNDVASNQDSLANACPGNYSLTINDENNCSLTESFKLNNPEQVSASLNTADLSCFESNDGSIELTVLSGEGTMSYTWTNASNNQNLNDLSAGVYGVEIRNDNGCSFIDSIEVKQPDSLEIELVELKHVNCFGEANGYIQINVKGGNGGYQINWSNGVQSLSNQNLLAGSYSVDVLDSKGCSKSKTFTVTEPELLTGILTKSDVTCFDACNGELSMVVNGGTAPYSYTWSNNAEDTYALNNLCAGNYNVNVLDAHNCSISDGVSILQPSPIQLSAALTDANCGQNNGSICLTVNGGTGDIDYSWSNTMNKLACNNNLLAGCYTAVVTDENNCALDTTFCISDIAGPQITIADSTNVSCKGGADGAVSFEVIGGDGEITYEFLSSTNQSFNVSNESVEGLLAGCYKINVTDSAGCKASKPICITEPEALTANVYVNENVSCFGLSDAQASVEAYGGTQPYVYSWQNGSDSTVSVGLLVGEVAVEVTDIKGCSVQAAAEVTQPEVLALSVAEFTNLTCYESCDGSISLGSIGGTKPYSYSWSNGQSEESISGLCIGDFKALVTDANGCVDSLVQSITQPDSIELSYVSKNAICGLCNGEAEITAVGGTGAYSYNWFGAGANTGEAKNISLCPDTFLVTVTDENSCSKDILVSVDFDVEPEIDSLIGTAAKCHDSFDGTVNPFVSGIAPFAYEWSGEGVNSTDEVLSGIGVGNYCLMLTDSNGCKVSSCIDVDEPTPVVPNFTGEIQMCYGNSNQVWMYASGGTPGYQYKWLDDETLDNPRELNAYEEKEYCFEVSDSNGCTTDPICFNTEISKPLLVSASGAKIICDGQTAPLQAYLSGGSGNPYNLGVFANAPYTGDPLTSTVTRNRAVLTVMPDTTTTYYFVLSDGCSEDAIDSVTVMVNVTPEIAIVPGDSSGCVPFVMPFNVKTNVPDPTYEFDFEGDGIIDYVGKDPNQVFEYKEAGIYKVAVNVISPDSCRTKASATGFIVVHKTPEVQFKVTSGEASMASPEIKFEAMYKYGDLFKWNFGDGDSVQGYLNDYILTGEYTSNKYEAPHHVYQDSGWYNVGVEITNRSGCKGVFELPIYVQPSFTFYAPNAFTPNGDGINEVFIPLGIGWEYYDYEFTIWDRWGELIYSSNDRNAPWDGTYMGQQVQMDVYVWQVHVRDIVRHDKHVFTGHVSLLR